MTKVHNRLTPKQVWKLSRLSDRKDKKRYIPFVEFNTIFKEIMIEIEDMLMEGRTVHLPKKMGALRFKKFKPKKKLPDWLATKKLWQASPDMKAQKFIVYQTNNHTLGWRVKLSWSKFNCDWKNQGLIVCKRTRGFERRLAWLLKTNNELIYTIKE